MNFKSVPFVSAVSSLRAAFRFGKFSSLKCVGDKRVVLGKNALLIVIKSGMYGGRKKTRICLFYGAFSTLPTICRIILKIQRT